MGKNKKGPSLKSVVKDVSSVAISRRPVNSETIRRNLMARKGTQLVQAAGSAPPLFPKKPTEGDAKLVFWIGSQEIKRARVRKGQSETWTMNNYIVLDEKSFQVVGNAQMSIPTALSDYFEDKKPEDVTCALLITFGGQMEPTGENRAGFKVWTLEEVRGLNKEEYDL